ncbi:NAD(P)/FAD-dependent oxidoreductase [Vannielia litorea]|uniref:NAD(P)/FAD-dependent oxidoreductase n=1 Tax=Vannielia litorea TaxID=1217970 RepID=UPI001BCF8379|nr:FAD-dependent oxidoreductase [Vannielia litorea]MBS8225681.1 FAD-binding oxidoreductase [Vannielia litorea]
MGERVVIVGGGLIGASCAYRLAQAGAEVVVVVAGAPGGAATSASFGWINASFYHDAHHFGLRQEAMAAWHRLEDELGRLVDWSGCLNWESVSVAELEGFGYPVEAWTGAELREEVPGLEAVPERAWFMPSEGVVEAAAVARHLLEASGARVVSGCRVERIVVEAGRVTGVAVAGGVVAADRVLVCAGTGAAELVEPLGVALPMLTRPAVVLRTTPVEMRFAPVLVPGGMEIRQDAEGCLIAPTSPNHQADATEALPESAEAMALATLERLRAMFPGVAMEMAEARLAWRPVPGDGLPVVGACGPEGLWLAVMHSGVTLGALMGELVAAEMGGAVQELLAPYRAARFG